jgi:hypothetical protein
MPMPMIDVYAAGKSPQNGAACNVLVDGQE